MNNLFIRAIEENQLVSDGDTVTVALSGGADSVSLLHMFVQVKDEYNLTLYAAHINHLIRGDEAERDEEFCKNLCKTYGIELFVKRVDVPSLSKELKISEELCGRNVRYEFFDEVAKIKNSKIATAHTLSDNAETLIYNIARGTSVNGLRSIPVKRGYIIRPLIYCNREYIENYCSENSLQFVTDSTNLTDDYTRNRIRHNVITELRKLNPSFEFSVKRLCEDANDVCEYIDKQSQRELENCKTNFGYDAEKLSRLDKALRRNVIIKICRANGAISVEHIHIELIENILSSGGAVDICNGYKAVVRQNIFRVFNKQNNQISDEEIYLTDILNSDFIFNGNNYSVRKVNTDEAKLLSEQSENNCLFCITQSQLERAVIRTRQSSDRFTYPDRKVTKPLRKVMNEMRIPQEIRDLIPLVAVENQVLWCENIGKSYLNHNIENQKINYILIKRVGNNYA